jgi:hypothetical protein
VLLVVSHTVVTAIVDFMRLLPGFDHTVIMLNLEAYSRHDLEAPGPIVRRRRYQHLRSTVGSFVIGADQAFVHDADTDQETDAAAEMAAAVVVSVHAQIVLTSLADMKKLGNRMWPVIHLLYEQVNERFRPVNVVDQADDPTVSTLSDVPTEPVNAVNREGNNHDGDNRSV